MTKQAFTAHFETAFGGRGFRRAKTLEEAIEKILNEKPITYEGKPIAVTKRFVKQARQIVWEQSQATA